MRTVKEAQEERDILRHTYFKVECPKCHEWIIYESQELNETTVLYSPHEEYHECLTIEDGKLVKHTVPIMISSDSAKDLITFKCPACGYEHVFDRSELEKARVKCTYFGDERRFFEMSEKSCKMAEEFRKKHDHSEDFKAQGKMGFSTIGQQFSYTFTPGGLGDGISIKCNFCGEEKDITDISNW